MQNNIILHKLDNQKIYHKLLQNGNGPVVTDTTELVIADNGVPYLKFKPFEKYDFIEHGFSTRLGGVSNGIYTSMNLTFNLDDNPENVQENFNRMAGALHIPKDRMVYSKQTHTINVIKVDESDCGMGITKERRFDQIDGLITGDPEVCLVTSYADCVPLFFVDPVRKCIGTSHSGWRGTVGNIASKTVTLMKETFGTNPEDLITFIGPSICVDCYEVSGDVANQFKIAYNAEESDMILQPGKEKDKYQLNLQMANYYNMLHEGIRAEHIHISDLCTCCNSDVLFSHRATAGKRGILCGFMYIKS